MPLPITAEHFDTDKFCLADGSITRAKAWRILGTCVEASVWFEMASISMWRCYSSGYFEEGFQKQLEKLRSAIKLGTLDNDMAYKKGLIEVDFKAEMLWKENYYNGLNIDKCHAPRVSIRHFMERLENLRSVEELEKLHDAATCPERKFTIQLFQNVLKMPV
ncbi:hypothetical protein WN944_015216 [Citrus x changshan-huyou]|uniref:Uncharacterized protein n=1 Tax=Citrus x changshan-huyou TaxID=2935761 RepID=A0AAP0MBD7_9ROSI